MENASTILGLTGVNSLGDGDCVPVGQPDVYNPLTQQAGDTRKATLKQIAEFAASENRIVGEYHFLSFKPSVELLIRKRLLPLEGQIAEVSLYKELADVKYVGDAKNATADWWYHCDAAGNRTTSGAYIRVEDARGLFFRNYGANSLYKAANGTPYDGGAVGSFQGDVMRRLGGAVKIAGSAGNYDYIKTVENGSLYGKYTTGNGKSSFQHAGGGDSTNELIALDNSREGPTSFEGAPSRISLYPTISF